MKRFLMMALAGLVALPNGTRAQDAVRPAYLLDHGWRFHQGDLDRLPIAAAEEGGVWQDVSLPHSWNRIGEYQLKRSAETNNFQGAGWYRLSVDTPKAPPGARHILQFDGVGTVADLWMNGHYVGQHRGGYSAFRFDVTDFVHPSGSNILVVKADNSKSRPGSPTQNVLPLSGDFFPYGGLYRAVTWIVAPAVQIDLLDHAGPGVYAATISADEAQAKLRLLTRLRNLGAHTRKVTVMAQVRDGDIVKASAQSPTFRLTKWGTNAVSQELTLMQPRLWQGRKDPYLYTLHVELRAGPKVLDRVDQPIGIRTMRFDPDQGFFLNGQPLPLHGVSRHQDKMGEGAALSDAEHRADMDQIAEIGANTIRFAHYQHAHKWFDLADQRGMIAWAEIPYVSIASFGDGPPDAAVVDNAQQQLTELIRQNFNHPSVAVWGIGNEVDSKVLFNRKPVQARALLDQLHRLAKQEDPLRMTAMADCCAEAPIAPPAAPETLIGATDVVGFNRYPGWYSLDARAMGTTLDRLHSKFPHIPMSVTEYGAGGALTQHSDNPMGGPINAFGRPHPEEYQSYVHEENWQDLKTRRYLWASWVWNMFDFASDFRGEGDAVDLNDKGLVTFDRKTRKDAFYFYQAHWSEAPVLHLTGRRYVDRPYSVIDIRAYSNAPDASLIVNGQDLGRQPCPEHICVWHNVALAPGANQIAVRATRYDQLLTDAMVLNGPNPRRDGVRINVGDLTGSLLSDGRRFGSDNFFAGGEAKALNATSMTALFERRAAPKQVASQHGTAVLNEGYREGQFRYQLPLENGDWTVKITSFEPEEARARTRSFSVVANGITAVSHFNPFEAAKGALIEVTRSFPVRVRQGQLTLEFVPETGPALVSAIEIERQ